MIRPLVREVQSNPCIVLRDLPFVARFYRYAFHHRASRKKELFVHVPLQRLFKVFHARLRSARWGVFDYARLEKSSRVRFDARNLQFQALYAPIFEHGYEQDVCALLDLFLPEGGTFFDVGSNWGYFSLHAASRHQQLAVHAFEPHPNTFRDLAACVEQAGLSGVVNCHNLALSDCDAEAHIVFPDGLHSGSAEVNRDARGTRITTRRLDGLELPPPHALKIDVEGHELEVLRGAQETLKSSRPFILMESKRREDSPGVALKPLQFLVDLGYELYVPGLKRRAEGIDYLIPYGCPLDAGQFQWLEAKDCLALVPVEADTRFLLQPDINILAWHVSRKAELLEKFAELPPP